MNRDRIKLWRRPGWCGCIPGVVLHAIEYRTYDPIRKESTTSLHWGLLKTLRENPVCGREAIHDSYPHRWF